LPPPGSQRARRLKRAAEEDRARSERVQLARKRLQALLRQLPRVGEDGELVAFERAVREDVRDDVAEARHH
jgi:hypothetical protein